MNFKQFFVLIILVILNLFEHALSRSILNEIPESFKVHSLNNISNTSSVEERKPLDNMKSYENVDGNNYFLPLATRDSVVQRNFVKPTKSIYKTNFENLPKKLYSNRNSLKAAKFPDPEDSNIKTHNFQKVFCRQIMKSELNIHGNIIDSVQHICDPLPSLQTTSIKTLFRQQLKPNPSLNSAYSHKEKRLVTTRPTTGNNCRRIMNSILNDRGEIEDSVTEVCDPPIVTTTTTRKPRLTTTTKATTTTPKPLVEICRPVMNSYLSEKGEIIDSVTIVCKMEKVD